jgi:hypothetical protein
MATSPKDKKKTLPKRSHDGPIKLARKTYLKYSKRIFEDPTHNYKLKEFQKYIVYIRKYKDYTPVRTSLSVYCHY